MKWVIQDLTKFSEEERKQLVKATPNSMEDYMHKAAVCCTKRKKGSYKAIVLYHKNDLIGWVMLDFFFSRNTNKIRTYIYVRVKYRRQRYGTMLMDKAKEVAKKMGRIVRVCPFDRHSKAFFKFNKITPEQVAPGYEYIMKNPIG